MRSCNNSSNKMVRIRRDVDPKLMKMSRLRFAIWVMDAGLITTSPQRSRPGNTDLQRLLLAQTITLQLMCGVSPAQSSKWLLVISFSNPERAITTTRTMIIWHKWWNSWEECPRTWLCQARTLRNSSIARDIWRESVDLTSGHSRKYSWRSTESRRKKLKLYLIS